MTDHGPGPAAGPRWRLRLPKLLRMPLPEPRESQANAPVILLVDVCNLHAPAATPEKWLPAMLRAAEEHGLPPTRILVAGHKEIAHHYQPGRPGIPDNLDYHNAVGPNAADYLLCGAAVAARTLTGARIIVASSDHLFTTVKPDLVLVPSGQIVARDLRQTATSVATFATGKPASVPRQPTGTAAVVAVKPHPMPTARTPGSPWAAVVHLCYPRAGHSTPDALLASLQQVTRAIGAQPRLVYVVATARQMRVVAAAAQRDPRIQPVAINLDQGADRAVVNAVKAAREAGASRIALVAGHRDLAILQPDLLVCFSGYSVSSKLRKAARRVVDVPPALPTPSAVAA